MAFERIKAAAKVLTAKEFDYTHGQWLPVRTDANGNFVSTYSPDGDSFENAYANMAAISKAARVVQPYLVDADGKELSRDATAKDAKAALNVLERLYAPNEDMSDEEFRDALVLLYLAKPKSYIRIHHTNRRANGTIDPASITGFTVLENVQPQTVGGVTTYRVGSNTYDRMEVMTFGGMNPYSVTEGYSPLQAAKRWTRIEDFIADMQAAHFRNGAVASGMFTVAAETEAQYLDIKRMMQKTLRGAKNSNNVLYNYAPTDPITGKPGDAQISWTPFTVPNKDLALKDLSDIVSKHQNEAFGVSGVIKGNVDETTYASAMVVEKFFVKYTVHPVVSALWRRFSHELNRCTGGFGYAFSFDLEIPVLNEELVQRAAARKTDAETLKLLAKSYTLKSIVEAFGFPESYAKLKPLEDTTTQTTPPAATDQVDTLADQPGDSTDNPAQTDNQTSAKAITPEERKSYEDQLRDELLAFTNDEIERMVDEYVATGSIPDAPGEMDDKLQTVLMAAAVGILIQRGQREQAAALAAVIRAGETAPGLSAYTVSEEMLTQYRGYLSKVATDYNAQTRQQVSDAIMKAVADGASKDALKADLQRLGLAEYRAKRLADSEINRASNNAAIDAYKRVSDAIDGKYFVKVWVADGPAPCPTCIALSGTDHPVDQAFVPHGQSFRDANGDDVVNTFVDMQTADAHPNCSCHLRFELRDY